MRVRWMWTVTAAVLLAAAAWASPIYGTWKGEVSGKAITLNFVRSGNRTDATMQTAAAQKPAAIQNFKMAAQTPGSLYPLTFTFRAPAVDGSGEMASYEMVQTSAGEATLRNLDKPEAPAVKLSKVGQ